MKVAFLDFDNTLVDDNTDTWLLKVFSKDVYKEMQLLSSSGFDWTDVMDTCFEKLIETGISAHEIIEKVKEIPYNPFLPDFLKKLKENGFLVYIISDANVVFIESILKRHNCFQYVDKVYSNPLEVTETSIKLFAYCGSAFHPKQHGCDRCGRSMCKGELINEIVEENKLSDATTIFAGDGGNDFCGMKVLINHSKDSYGCIRDGYALSKRANHLPATLNKIFWKTLLDLNNILEEKNIL